MIISPDHFLVHADGTYDWTPSRVSSAWALTLTKVRDALSNPRYRRLVLLVGIPGAGKTTWLRSHAEADTIYIDATFTKRSDRTHMVHLVAELDRPIGVVLFSTPFEECLRRNALRTVDRIVPNEKMFELRAQLTDTPPVLSEGFDEIQIVSGT